LPANVPEMKPSAIHRRLQGITEPIEEFAKRLQSADQSH